jgi:hypothetical protein
VQSRARTKGERQGKKDEEKIIEERGDCEQKKKQKSKKGTTFDSNSSPQFHAIPQDAFLP